MKQALIIAARFVGIGWYVGVCIVAGFFGGRWVGQKVESEAFFSLLGLGIGMLVAVWGIWASYSLIVKKGQGNNGNEEK